MKSIGKWILGSVLCLFMLFSALAQEDGERIGEYDDLLQMFSGRPSEVTVYLSEEFLGRLMENEWDLFYQMTENAGIRWWEFEIDRDEGRIRLLDIEYYEDFYICATEADICSAFAGAQSNMVRMYLDEALYKEMTDNGWEKLNALTERMGIYDGDAGTNGAYGTITYRNFRCSRDLYYVENTDDVRAAIEKTCAEMKSSFAIVPCGEFFDYVDENLQAIYQLCAYGGMFSYKCTYYSDLYAWSFNHIEYYPGSRIIFAVRENDLSLLSDEEMRLYEKARKIADEVRGRHTGAQNEEILILDELTQYLASECKYTLEGGWEHNTAIGALLNGLCDCDGFADAMYLLGNLAGLEINYQLGYTKDGGEHMWNVVRIDGNWYFTDPTGCNIDSMEKILHVDWMLMDSDYAKDRYTWYEEMEFAPLCDFDQPVHLNACLGGRVFDTAEEARKYLECEWTANRMLAVRNVKSENADDTAAGLSYGFGGSYVKWVYDDILYFTLLETWKDKENCVECPDAEKMAEVLSEWTDASVVIVLPPDVYDALLSDENKLLYLIEGQAGMLERSIDTAQAKGVIVYTDMRFAENQLLNFSWSARLAALPEVMTDTTQ